MGTILNIMSTFWRDPRAHTVPGYPAGIWVCDACSALVHNVDLHYDVMHPVKAAPPVRVPPAEKATAVAKKAAPREP